MTTITRTFAEAYRGFTRVSSWAQSPFFLFVRLYWGFQFMQTGWGKLHNLAHVTHFFTSLGIPAPGPTAYGVRWDLGHRRALVVTNRASGDGPTHDYWLLDFGWGGTP